MHEVSTVLILMCIVTVLAFWTRSWSIPYSTLMVLVGVAIALLAAANLYLDGRKLHGDAVSEIDYLRSHFRAQADSWLMRLDLDDVSFLENQSPFCLSIVRSFIVAFRSSQEWENATFAERKATLVFRTMLSEFPGVLTAQRHRLNELARQSIIERSLVQKLEHEIDMEETRIKSISNVS